MKAADFELLSKLVRERSGLVLTEDKAYLLESRLAPLARKFGAKTLEEMTAQLRLRPDQAVSRAITEAMTTNETLFFRDTKPFEQLRRVVLPKMLEGRASQKRLRIWCAAASSGQEPYSIAMTLKDLQARLEGWRIEILGTDLSTDMITRARLGSYSQFEVQRGLSIQQLMKFFVQTEDRWQITPELRNMVEYREFNLLHDMRGLGTFDIVFCRNVLIYFDQPTKAQILGRIASQMTSDGILYMGGSETTIGITERFEPVADERGLYRLTNK